MSIGESDRHRRPILRKEGRLGAYSLDGGRRSGGGRGGREEGGVEVEVVDNGERLQRVGRPGRGRLEVDKPGGHKEAPPSARPQSSSLGFLRSVLVRPFLLSFSRLDLGAHLFVWRCIAASCSGCRERLSKTPLRCLRRGADDGDSA